MSTTWLEGLESEAAEYDEGELYDSESDLEWDDSETDEGESEESRASRRRRAQARQLAVARRQAQVRAQALGRARTTAVRPRPMPPPPPPPPARAAAAAIRAVDLDSRVAHDSLRRELALQRRRMSRSEYAAVAGLAVSQFVESFDQPQNVYARAALRFAPLLLLTPQRRGRGLESFVADPRVIGGAAILGITVLGEQRAKASIDVAAPSELAANSSLQLNAQVVTPRGEVVSGRTVRWSTTDDQVARVDATGRVTGVKAGTVFLIASAEGVPVKRIPLVVK
ncbi:hypothetical protein E1262_29875 [Jiangella aurantiaca]|uniref:BIG2 domain-containing protein n=1 Tax=Jiangella aurantiaca TaxID=2530373 RepID=A0A4R5A073_9ACTN|nr:Ig-like domain-containing protein [Jiangella aurantiaca]TDD63829.1 hypothetical protein E1262_29875 [Jiangella aurantiaca]